MKTDVGAVSDTIRHVNTGVRRAVKRAEARLRQARCAGRCCAGRSGGIRTVLCLGPKGVRFGAAALKRSFLYARRRGMKRKKRRRERDEDEVRTDRRTEGPRIRTRAVDPT